MPKSQDVTMPLPPSDSLIAWAALAQIDGIGGRTLGRLLAHFHSPHAIFAASPQDWQVYGRLPSKVLAAIQKADLAAVAAQIIAWQALQIQLLTWESPGYPSPLLAYHDRPALFFAKGALIQNWERCIAIVGTREPSPDSAALAQALAAELAGRGWVVVSGLARGIDTAAHQGALLAGATAAFVGCGVEAIFPAQNRPLAAEIAHTGGLYAEVPPGTVPVAGTLMARNRLIAAAARATFVIEAGERSGSLEAARQARKLGRAVFTLELPQAGNQALLRMEARPLSPSFSDWEGLHQQLSELPPPPQQLDFL